MDTPQVLLDHHLKTLRLPTFLREYDKVAQQCADEALDYPRYLFRLTELELLDRERRATERRIKQARFPVVKSLDSFDFLAIPSLNKLLVLELTRGEFIDRRECVLALGNSGTGKTHIALAIGLAACQKGYRVRFTTAASLVHELMEARDEKRLLRFQKHLAVLSCGLWMNSGSCRSRKPAPRCSSRSSVSAMNARPRWSPAICRLMNGPRSWAPSGSLAHYSIGSPMMSTSSR